MAFNSDLNDSFIRHAIDLEKFKAGERRKALSLLKDLEQELVAELAKADLGTIRRTDYQTARLQALLKEARAIIGSAYKEIRDDQNSDWAQLAQVEHDFVLNSINTLAGVELASVAVDPEQLKAIVSDLLIDGAPSAEWWDRQAGGMAEEFSDVVRKGMLRGQTTDDIVAEVRANVTGMAAKNMDSLVQTSIAAVSSGARTATYAANNDVIKGIQQHSTFDSRTTPICQAYSGATYTVDTNEPIDGTKLPFVNAGGSSYGIPRHWSCRSYWLPVVKSWQEMALGKLKTGGRPAESADAYFKQRLQAQGLSDEEIARVVRNAQASMDGQVADTLTFEGWLKTKSDVFQQKLLGPSKYRLWKNGKISLRDMVDQTGSPLTVEELKNRAA